MPLKYVIYYHNYLNYLCLPRKDYLVLLITSLTHKKHTLYLITLSCCTSGMVRLSSHVKIDTKVK